MSDKNIPPITIESAVKMFLENERAVKSKATARAYKQGVTKFTDMLAEEDIPLPHSLDNITSEHFIRFPGWLLGMDYSKKTANVYAVAVKCFLEWLVIYGAIMPTYSETVRIEKAFKQINRKRESKLPRFPGRQDVTKILEAIRVMPYESPIKERNIAILEFLASTGCRNAEAVNLKIEDFAKDLRSAVVTGKGNKERRVFISETATEALKQYWRARVNSELTAPAFSRHDRGAGKKVLPITTTTVRNIVKEVANMAGVKVFSPHYFRHAFAIRLLGETKNLALTQDLMGHTSPAATRVYAKIYPDDMEKAHREVFG